MTKTIDDIYKKVPALNCKGLCADSCGVILLQQVEYERITALAPIPEKRTGMESGPPFTPTDDALTCPMLRAGRCTVHAARPLICRIWGTVKAARSAAHCQHGCRPKRWLTDAESHALIDEAIALDPRQRSLHADMDEAVRQ